jgi:protein tyrosine phosphatase
MEEYVSSVTAALKVREDTRTVQRTPWPRHGLLERPAHDDLQCAYACSVGLQLANRQSNRYADVIAYDRTRVITPGFPEGHYLNANWVRERFGGKWHIATQAPLPSTAHSFLSLFLNPTAPAHQLTGGETVPFQLPRTIVQLTQNVERRVTKATPYFPTEVGQSTTWTPQRESGNITSLPSIIIELVATEQEDCWQHSTLRIAYAHKPSEARLVRHLLFQVSTHLDLYPLYYHGTEVMA